MRPIELIVQGRRVTEWSRWEEAEITVSRSDDRVSIGSSIDGVGNPEAMYNVSFPWRTESSTARSAPYSSVGRSSSIRSASTGPIRMPCHVSRSGLRGSMKKNSVEEMPFQVNSPGTKSRAQRGSVAPVK